MISDWVIRLLLAIHLILFLVSAIEQDLPKAKYGLGGSILLWGVLTMGGK